MTLKETHRNAREAIWRSLDTFRGKSAIGRDSLYLVVIMLLYSKYLPNSKDKIIGFFVFAKKRFFRPGDRPGMDFFFFNRNFVSRTPGLAGRTGLPVYEISVLRVLLSPWRSLLGGGFLAPWRILFGEAFLEKALEERVQALEMALAPQKVLKRKNLTIIRVSGVLNRLLHKNSIITK